MKFIEVEVTNLPEQDKKKQKGIIHINVSNVIYVRPRGENGCAIVMLDGTHWYVDMSVVNVMELF